MQVLSEPIRKRVADGVVDPFEDLCIDLPDPPASPACQQIVVAVEKLGLSEIGEDIIFPVDKRGIDSPGPQRDVGEGLRLALSIIIQLIYPGALAGLHLTDQGGDHGRVETEFFQGVLHPGLTH